MSILDLFTKPFARLVYTRALNKERALGYRLDFSQLPDRWISSKMVFDMTPVWKEADIDATGVNYFTIGAINNGVSARFDPQSQYYQAWFGGYIVRFAEHRDWTIRDHWELGEVDQRKWLSLYGDPDPKTAVIDNSIQRLGELQLENYSGTLYEGKARSHSDVGNRGFSIQLPLLAAGFAHHLKFQNPKLEIASHNLIPNYSHMKKQIAPFHKVELMGLAAIIGIAPNTKAILYANGTEFMDKDGIKINTYSKIKPELVEMLKNINIVEL